MVLFVVLSVLFFFKFLYNGIMLIIKLKDYPGYTQILPKYFPKMPYLNPYAFSRITTIDMDLRNENPDLNDLPFVKQNVFFGEYRLVVSNASVAREIMLNSSKEFPKLKERMDKLFGQYGSNILIASGEDWKKHRVLCNPAFSKKNLELLTVVSFNETMKEMKNWKDDGIIDVNVAMSNITLDIILKAGFGYNLENEKKTFGKYSFKQNIEKILDIRNLAFQLLAPDIIKKILLWMPFETRQHQYLDTVKDLGSYIDQIIDNNLNSNEKKFDLLSLLLTSKDDEQVLTREEVKADSFIFLVAGHDTTSSQLAWTLYEIARNHYIQDKMHQEIIENIKENSSLEDYENLKFTSCVVNESMRLHPPIHGVIKESVKSMTLKGDKKDLKIEPNMKFLINFKSIQRDPRYWEDPLKFNPERFLNKSIPSSIFLPFSLGPRKCIGFQFSLLESNVILATILKEFSVHLVDSKEPKDADGLVARPHGLKLQFKKRK